MATRGLRSHHSEGMNTVNIWIILVAAIGKMNYQQNICSPSWQIYKGLFFLFQVLTWQMCGKVFSVSQQQ